jgi:transcriptional regulator with XRE-family HTH domain
MSNFVDIGARLKEERERLKLNQDEFAALGGVKRKTQFNYESGERSPDAAYLSALAAHGVDLQYILTGERSSSASVLTAQQEEAGYSVEVLSKEEQALLDNYRNSPEAGKKIVEATVLAAAKPKPKPRKLGM